MYSPTLGRWIQQDPVVMDAASLYEYVEATPLHAVDALGLAGNSTTQPEAVQRLIAVSDGEPLPGKCGAFRWVIHWELQEPAARNGWIIQKVTATYDRRASNQVQGAQRPGDCDSKTIEYWEAWPVLRGQRGAGGRVADTSEGVTLNPPRRSRIRPINGIDTFEDKNECTCTSGTITVIGVAWFWEGDTLPRTFVLRNRQTQAGNLPSTTTDPGIGPNGTQVPHELEVTFDCPNYAKQPTTVVRHVP